MKKRRFWRFGLSELAFILVFSFVLFSCKTNQIPLNHVEPLDLIDSKNQIFMAIPEKADPNLVASLIQMNVKGISQDDAFGIAERISVLYVGLVRTRRTAEFQISALVDFPKIAVSKVFTRKNGFEISEKEISRSASLPLSYPVYSKDGVEIALPEPYIAFLGRDVQGMLEVFHGKSAATGYENPFPLPDGIYDFLKVKDDEENLLKFYATNPSSFLTMLTGANLNLKLSYVCGTMAQDSNFNEQYVMNLEFDFLDPRLVPAAKGALSLSFGLTDSAIVLENPTHLKISNIKIGKEHLYRLLVIKK